VGVGGASCTALRYSKRDDKDGVLPSTAAKQTRAWSKTNRETSNRTGAPQTRKNREKKTPGWGLQRRPSIGTREHPPSLKRGGLSGAPRNGPVCHPDRTMNSRPAAARRACRRPSRGEASAPITEARECELGPDGGGRRRRHHPRDPLLSRGALIPSPELKRTTHKPRGPRIKNRHESPVISASSIFPALPLPPPTKPRPERGNRIPPLCSAPLRSKEHLCHRPPPPRRHLPPLTLAGGSVPARPQAAAALRSDESRTLSLIPRAAPASALLRTASEMGQNSQGRRAHKPTQIDTPSDKHLRAPRKKGRRRRGGNWKIRAPALFEQ